MSIYRSLYVCLSFKYLAEVPEASKAEGAPRADPAIPPLCPSLLGAGKGEGQMVAKPS